MKEIENKAKEMAEKWWNDMKLEYSTTQWVREHIFNWDKMGEMSQQYWLEEAKISLTKNKSKRECEKRLTENQ